MKDGSGVQVVQDQTTLKTSVLLPNSASPQTINYMVNRLKQGDSPD